MRVVMVVVRVVRVVMVRVVMVQDKTELRSSERLGGNVGLVSGIAWVGTGQELSRTGRGVVLLRMTYSGRLRTAV